MQQFSFAVGDPVFDVQGWRVSLELITFDNVYGLPADLTAERSPSTDRDGARRIEAPALTWAGGQRHASGSASMLVSPTDDGIAVAVKAAMPGQRIRSTKLIISGLPVGELVGHRWTRERVTRGGTTVHYPGTTHTALVFLALAEGEYVYFESLDSRLRAKRFAVMQRPDGVAVELIHEDAAREMTQSTEVPQWRIGRTRDPEAVVRRHDAHVARAFGLQPWETRGDVPAWMREVSLVVALHGMHWSGYTFNTYDDMARALDFVAARIDGRRVLAFLPGWEGRYYWQYGDYRPDPLLGGVDGFSRLAAMARERGVHLMPMFGANCVNTNVPGYRNWGAPAEMRSPSGLVFQGNRPDWDGGRAHDPGWQAWLNPGAPSWRRQLASQVSTLVERYEVSAVFFDTQHVWINDPRYDVYGGLVALRDQLKTRFPDLLVAGEGWYDALGAVTPVSQSGLPQAWPDVFAGYNRSFLHLSAGDPARGSTGVHEQGYNAFAVAPDQPWMLPTLTIVDGSLSDGRAGAERVIEQAREYARRWL